MLHFIKMLVRPTFVPLTKSSWMRVRKYLITLEGWGFKGVLLKSAQKHFIAILANC